MRPIEFRGIRKDGRGMVFGSLLMEGDFCSISDRNPDVFPLYIVREVLPESVGQFTGLTDKNGVKIFEGDVVEVRNWNFVVVFDHCEFIGRNLEKENSSCQLNYTQLNFTVIGNIHDGKEYLSTCQEILK
jgi:uncharacterized phage protein (TIGR01671 family)